MTPFIGPQARQDNEITGTRSSGAFGPQMSRAMFQDGSEGIVVGDVGLPTVNAESGWKDAAMALSPAYSLGRGGIKGLLSHFSPAYMLAKGRYGLPDDENEAIEPEDIDNVNRIAFPPSPQISGGKVYMEHGGGGMVLGDDPDFMKQIDTEIAELSLEEKKELDSLLSRFTEEGESAPDYEFQEGTDGAVVDDVVNQLSAADASVSGVMTGATPQTQRNVEDRLSLTPAVNQPQNPEERAVFEEAILALQGQLEPEIAEEAINEFIETFGPEAYRELVSLVMNERDGGGVVEPVNGETTVADGEIQGEDVIAGKIVNPVTGEQTANLRVGENEYIEPADSLQRRAMAAGLPADPRNGAMVRGLEEKQLEAMYG